MQGVLIIEPRLFHYACGYFFQSFNERDLVRCAQGRMLDDAVDLRKGLPTYGKNVAVELTEDYHLLFFTTNNFAHGFAVLSEIAVSQYMCNKFYHQRRMAVSASSMTLLVSIGKFQQSMLISQRRIRSIRR